ncbi:MAG: UvrD-helicase domain-containing protein [Anaerobutyricum soehngenii]
MKSYLKNLFPLFQEQLKKKKWGLYEEVKEFHQEVREQINSQKENVFTAPAEELQREAAVIYPLLEEYMALTKRFAEIYFLCKKKEKNVYDFDDLEHFALELLVESYDEQGAAQPSETAKELSKKYKMIFVDEYQDTNLVQETILEMLLNKKHNSLFTVGDVKQSIYRFRQARPDLFLRRKDQYISQADAGVSIELRDNFQKCTGSIDIHKLYFSQLMEKEFGGVDYNEKTALRPGDGGR